MSNQTLTVYEDFQIEIQLNTYSCDIIRSHDFEYDLIIDGFAISTSMFVKILNKLTTLTNFVQTKLFSVAMANKLAMSANFASQKRMAVSIANQLLTTVKFVFIKQITVSIKNRHRVGKDTVLGSLDSMTVGALDSYSLSAMADNFGAGAYFLLAKRVSASVNSKITAIADMAVFSQLRLSTHDAKTLGTMDIVTMSDLDRALV